jgi:hypothetical protein
MREQINHLKSKSTLFSHVKLNVITLVPTIYDHFKQIITIIKETFGCYQNNWLIRLTAIKISSLHCILHLKLNSKKLTHNFQLHPKAAEGEMDWPNFQRINENVSLPSSRAAMKSWYNNCFVLLHNVITKCFFKHVLFSKETFLLNKYCL